MSRVRTDLENLTSWTDAELLAAHNDVQNKDSWSDSDRLRADKLRNELLRRRGVSGWSQVVPDATIQMHEILAKHPSHMEIESWTDARLAGVHRSLVFMPSHTASDKQLLALVNAEVTRRKKKQR